MFAVKSVRLKTLTEIGSTFNSGQYSKTCHPNLRIQMTLCPIALAASCLKCPVVSYCPLKTVIGDFVPDTKPEQNAANDANKDSKS